MKVLLIEQLQVANSILQVLNVGEILGPASREQIPNDVAQDHRCVETVRKVLAKNFELLDDVLLVLL